MNHYLVLFVLSSVRETRNYGCHSGGRCDLAGVYHDEQLHQVIVDFAAAALYDVDIFSSNRLADLDTLKVDGREKAMLVTN